MDEIKHFLELSTIHGLYYISATRNWTKYFWVLVVFGGFTGTGYLIYTSFYNWEQSPISTTIETLPISKITFPNVTVCPPKESLTLNFDIMKSEKMDLDEKTRSDLFAYSLNVILENVHTWIKVRLFKR